MEIYGTRWIGICCTH